MTSAAGSGIGSGMGGQAIGGRSSAWPAPIRATWSVVRRVVAAPAAAAEAIREWRFPGRVRHVSGAARVTAERDELVVVCLVRDGARYLPAFLAHYRGFGAKHVVLLDNGSTDGTVEQAAAEPDVTVLRTDAPYRSHKRIAKRYLVHRFGAGNWVLCVDIDEFFDYPHRDRIALRNLLRYLNHNGYTAVVAHLLDLFPRGPLAAVADNWQAEHRFYDVEHLERVPYAAAFGEVNHVSNQSILAFYGGVRARHFGVRAMLTKHPLLFPAAGVRLISSHVVRGARVADLSAVLLHYKYVDGFMEYAERIVRERSFHERSAEYRRYVEVLGRAPARSLYSEGARELCSIEQLVREGFLMESDALSAHWG